MLLSVYDPYEDFVDAERLQWAPLTHLASELAEAYGYSTPTELEEALQHAFDVCLLLNIPIDRNFKRIYLYDYQNLFTDWLLSDLGSYLLLINGSSRNQAVAKARMYLIGGIKVKS